MTDHFIAARPLFFTLAVAKLAKLPAHALPPGGPFGAPGPRVSVRARNYLTGTHTPHAVEGPHLNSTEPQHLTQPNHAHEDHSPPRSRYQAATPHALGIITPGSSENPVIIWISGRDPALDYT